MGKNKYIEGLVSVIIPTYKRNDYLKRAIASVLFQTYNKIEIIIVDDNIKNDEYSKKVQKIIDFFKSDKIIYVNPKNHKNGSFARNQGLKFANGQYVAFLDDDDYWDKDKLKKQVEVLEKLNKEYIAVACLKVYVDKKKIFRSALPYKDGDVLEKIIMREIDISTCTTLIYHNAIDIIGGFDENLKRKQDVEFYIHLFTQGKLKLLKEHLTFIDISNDINNNLSFNELVKMNDDFFFSVKDVLNKYSIQKQKQIRAIYDFECGRHLLKKEKKIFLSIKLCIGAVCRLSCIISLVKRMIKGWIEVIFCYKILGWYKDENKNY